MKRFFSMSVLFSCFTLLAQTVCDPVNVVVKNGCVTAAPAMKTVVMEDFKKSGGDWMTLQNYKDNTHIDTRVIDGKKALVFSNAGKKRTDTAFGLVSRTFQFRKPLFYSIEFEAAANIPTGGFTECRGDYCNQITFFGKNRKVLEKRPFRYTVPEKGYARIILSGKFPADTDGFSLALGADQPNLRPKQYVAYTNFRIQVLDMAAPWARKASFLSGVFPLEKRGAEGDGNTIAWKISGKGASARFQIATAPDVNGFPGKFTPFAGPDGKSTSWFEKSRTRLPDFPSGMKWIRYKASLSSTEAAAAVLEQVKIAGNVDSGWKTAFDKTPPTIVRASPSPSLDVNAPLEVTLTDATGMDWSSLQTFLDGGNVTTNQIVRTPKGFSVKPDKPFSPGLHKLRVKLRDLCGNPADTTLFFFFGKRAVKGIVTLRDDGMTLIDGKPFFPIGVYNVKKCEFNGKNYDEAFRKLKAAGFNFAQTYATKSNASFREFMNAAEKYGFKIWTAGEGGSNDDNLDRIAKSLIPDRLNPALIAWYVGDDTRTYNTPEQLRRRAGLVSAIAPRLITAQADAVTGENASRYLPFVRATDAFLPEIYSVRKNTGKTSDTCVAKVIQDMDQCFKDIKTGHAAPRTIWPIIQYFKGWKMWERFPTETELRAMSYAAIIRGAHGIIWYVYAGWGNNHGMSDTPEHWKIMSGLSKELDSLLPILQERASEHPPVPEILDGPAKNSLGNSSLSVLAKVHNGKTYLFCVNSTMSNIRAEWSVPGLKSGRHFLSRKPIAVKKSRFIENFKPYEVQIYELQ